MITYQQEPASAWTVPLDTLDQMTVAIVALLDDGVTAIDKPTLLRATEFTAGEIDRHGAEALDRAKIVRRQRAA